MIHQCLDCSMHQLRKETVEKIKEYANEWDMQMHDAVWYIVTYEYGYIIYFNRRSSTEGLPEDFVKMLEFAKRKGCDMLLLDTDGAEYDELETYD